MPTPIGWLGSGNEAESRLEARARAHRAATTLEHAEQVELGVRVETNELCTQELELGPVGAAAHERERAPGAHRIAERLNSRVILAPNPCHAVALEQAAFVEQRDPMMLGSQDSCS